MGAPDVVIADVSPSVGPTELSEVARQPSIAKALEAVRQLLGMEVAYYTTFRNGSQVFREMSGAPASFGIHERFELPLEQTTKINLTQSNSASYVNG